MGKRKEPNTVLLAIINDKQDYARLHHERWYRIPVDKAPPIIRNRQAKIIAFYPTSKFGKDKWKIRHYGIIERMTEAGRRDLFPDEPANHPKANRRYFKIQLGKLLELSQPITSRKGHRITFVPTSERRFFNYTDINFLFNCSSLEDRLFHTLNEASIPSERQWVVTMKQATYILDFAIFCKTRPIDVECDGDVWHDTPTGCIMTKTATTNSKATAGPSSASRRMTLKSGWKKRSCNCMTPSIEMAATKWPMNLIGSNMCQKVTS